MYKRQHPQDGEDQEDVPEKLGGELSPKMFNHSTLAFSRLGTVLQIDSSGKEEDYHNHIQTQLLLLLQLLKYYYNSYNYNLYN